MDSPRCAEPRSARTLTVGAVVSLALVAACGVGAPNPYQDSAGAMSSATATVRLVLREQARGHVTSATASVTVDDATREAASAARTAIEAPPPTHDQALRADLAAAAATLARHLHEASDAVGDAGLRPRVRRALAADAKHLERLERRASAP